MKGRNKLTQQCWCYEASEWFRSFTQQMPSFQVLSLAEAESLRRNLLLMPDEQLAKTSASITLRTTSGMVLFSSAARIASTGMKCITHSTVPARPIVDRSMTQVLIDSVDRQVCLPACQRDCVPVCDF